MNSRTSEDPSGVSEVDHRVGLNKHRFIANAHRALLRRHRQVLIALQVEQKRETSEVQLLLSRQLDLDIVTVQKLWTGTEPDPAEELAFIVAEFDRVIEDITHLPEEATTENGFEAAEEEADRYEAEHQKKEMT